MKYKVVFVAPWAPPFGGISSSLIELVPRLKQLGCDVAVFSRHSKDIHYLVDNNVPIFRFSIARLIVTRPLFVFASIFKHLPRFSLISWKKFVRSAIAASYIESSLNDEQKSLIYITYSTDDLFLAPFLKSYPKTKAVFTTIYAGLLLYPKLYIKHKKYIRYCLMFSDKILSCSNYCASLPQKILGTTTPYAHIYNSVDHHLYSPSNDSYLIRAKLSIPTSAIVLLFFSRMSVDMGTDFVLANASSWLYSFPDLYIVIAGSSDSLGQNVYDYALTNQRIKCSFDIPFQEKPFYYAASDIFSAPTKLSHPCLGISNIEAMMSGKAVLSSDTGGHREVLVHQKSGLLSPFINGELDPTAYLKLLTFLISDPLLRTSMGEEARQYSTSNFTNDIIADAHLDLFNEIR